jgi:hypothetical protein
VSIGSKGDVLAGPPVAEVFPGNEEGEATRELG